MDPVTIAMGLAQFAPAIIKWITGSEQAEAAAGKVVEIAQAVTGRPTGPEALEAMRADAAVALQFRQAVLAQEAELDKAYLADRQDARRRDVALAQAGVRNTRANWMVAMDVAGLICSLAAMMGLGYIKAQHSDAISEGVFGALLAQFSTLASYFGLCLRDAHQFEFGSSRSSRDKDEIIARSPAIK
jgi:hypothetical protein